MIFFYSEFTVKRMEATELNLNTYKRSRVVNTQRSKRFYFLKIRKLLT